MTKRLIIIQTATKLFYMHGILKITVERICNEACVSKRTFYKYFKNKNALAKVIIKDFTIMENDVFLKHKNREVSFQSKILGILQDKIKLIRPINEIFFKDILNSSDELNTFSIALIKEGERSFFEFISEEQKIGRVKDVVSASVITYLLTVKLREMVYDEELIKRIPSLSKRLKCIVEILINGMGNILNKEER